MADRHSERRAIATNRRARFEYEILDSWEAGIALLGPEVKALRTGKANLSDSYATVRRGEAFLVNMHISPYDKAGRDNPDPRRERKLLLHRREIARLQGAIAEKGLTLVPLKLYFKDGRAKVELGLARGKRRYDKRETIRRREQEREMQRAVRGRRRT
ncbi:MAG: SsrA-binding protein SmpB [Myxococcota bacterium]|jgi:SsrA-binding protein|nr:SsrA-binding protein [Deltaproteobacteria bacterium]MCP4243523.1 SsrA-binding protein SmpB [bacterium]MDP6075987.1 SsrA-binding protein SmpB [Myxococcota bacterium]MDP6243379.1 SsrA-binding protein SmpB [Myxococcota bacterium]MDP7076362.1 SsrA-binding protein SmpB [Myxococcota bacterium]